MSSATGRPRTDHVPVVVLTGALGAGKTTVLNHVLRHRGDSRIGVLANDVGTVPMDAMLIDSVSDATAGMAGGCLCCTVDDGTLAESLRDLAAPRLGLDALVVETSGVAEPRIALQKVHEALDRHARLGGLVHVVDALAEPAPLPSADLVLVTKTDLLPEVERSAVVARLTAAASGLVLESPHGAVDPDLLFDVRHDVNLERQLLLGEAAEHDETPHVHVGHTTWTHGGPLHPGRLARVLEDGLPGAFRVKGVVDVDGIGNRRRWSVHRVGSHVQITPGPRGQGATVVAIGHDVDERTARIELDACRLTDGEPVSVEETYGFVRRIPRDLRDDLDVETA